MMKTRVPKPVCPHCGNADPDFHQDNGLSSKSDDYTLLCVARIPTEEWAFDFDPTHDADRVDKDGKIVCGVQWQPSN
jgi:hypothetical protein